MSGPSPPGTNVLIVRGSFVVDFNLASDVIYPDLRLIMPADFAIKSKNYDYRISNDYETIL